MFWSIEKTTSADRTAVMNALGCAVSDLKRAVTVLDTVTEELSLNCDKAGQEWLYDMVCVAHDLVTGFLTTYNLTVADDREIDVKNYLAAAERVKTAVQCEAAFNTLKEKRRDIPCNLEGIEDEEAIPILKALQKGAEA